MLNSTALILAMAFGQAEAQESPSYKHLELLEPMIDAHVPVAISDETLELKPSVVQVRMADGTRLAARVYKPQGEGPVPAIVVRTPYSATFGSRWVPDTARRFAKWGYATVVQDCRGTGDSEGVWEPFGNEHIDGEETLAWTLKQPWCNGKLATFGGSYTGFTQWAAAPGAGSSISAMVSAVPALDWYEICYVGGAYRLRANRVWDAAMARPKSGQAAYINMDFNGARTIKFNNGTWEDVFRDLPLRTWDKAFDIKVPWAQEVVEHPSIDDYWKRSTTSNRANEIATPNLSITGWYDLFLNQVLSHLPKVRREAATESARRHQHLIIGPWGHYGPTQPIGELDFGKNATIDVEKRHEQWLRYWLENDDTGVEDWPFLRIFVMGANKWRAENEWPLARTQYTEYYFRSMGDANTSTGDGLLSREKPITPTP